ncbi:MAG: tetratricopeptide repeat protein [Candidatus Asgardarchaeia archaeon]
MEPFYKEAIRYYREAIKADPNFVITYFDFAYLYKVLGRYDKALEYYREAYKHARSDYWRSKAEKYIKEIKRCLS